MSGVSNGNSGSIDFCHEVLLEGAGDLQKFHLVRNWIVDDFFKLGDGFPSVLASSERAAARAVAGGHIGLAHQEHIIPAQG